MRKIKSKKIALMTALILTLPTITFGATSIEGGINGAVGEAQKLGIPLATLGLVIGGIMGIWGSFFGDGIGPHAKKIIAGIGIGLALIGGAASIAAMAGGWFGL